MADHSRKVTEKDFRLPEFRDANPEDYEFRSDGKVVRKDRWETGLRRVAGILHDSGVAGINRNDFEVEDVVQAVRNLAELSALSGHAATESPGDPSSGRKAT